MAQPTPNPMTLNPGVDGDPLFGDLIGSDFAQGVLLCYSTADGAANFVMLDAGLPVQPATGTIWTVTGIVAVTGPLTDAQLRATAVSVSGTVTAIGPLTDTQLRATAVPVSAASLPLPVGAATESTLGTLNGKVTVCNTSDVAGALTANAGTNLNTSALALEAGGNLAAVATAAAQLAPATVKRFRVIATANGDNVLIAAVAAKKFRLRSLLILATSTTSVSFYLYTTTDTGVLGNATNKLKVDLDGVDASAGMVLQWNPDGWVETTTANEDLKINLSAATPVVVIGTYEEVS